MNRKRIFTVFVAVAIAGMLMALPYESNGFVFTAGVVTGVAITLGMALLYNWLTDKESKTNVVVADTNATNIKNSIMDYFTRQDEIYNTLQNNHENIVALLEKSKLSWERLAEQKAVDIINRTTWDEYCENYVTEEFDSYVKNILLAQMYDYLNFVGDIALTLNSLTNKDIKTGGGGISLLVDTDGGNFYMRNVTLKLEIGGITADEQYNSAMFVSNLSTLQNKSLSSLFSYEWWFWWQNHEDKKLRSRDYVFKVGDYYTDDTGSHVVEKIQIKISNDTTSLTYTITSTERYEISFDDLENAYNEIRLAIINSAQTYWEYLHSLGYYNATDVPDNLIPVYPDVWLHDFWDLLNVTEFNESFALYYALMQQLLEQLNNQLQQNNTEPINWTTLDIGNFTGKKANITLCEASATNGNINVIIDADLCYIIPYQDLT
ncbi:MAG: hypothetical protein DRN11_03795, partial [Thermoplasmata archaeon]